MTTEIAAPDLELEELMAQLELETGVAVAASPAPAAKVAPVAAAVVAAVVAPVTTTTSEDDELLAGLDAQPSAAATAQVTMADDGGAALLAELEGTTAAAVVTPVAAAVVAPVVEASALSPEDEIAALEAELAGEAAPVVEIVGTPKTTAPVILEIVQEVHSDEPRGMSFIPGEILVDPEKFAIEPTVQVVPDTTPKPALGALDFFTDPEKFTFDTAISDNDLDRCFIEQNSLRSFYGVAAAKAEKQAARVKIKFEVLEATLYEEHRRLAAEDGEKVTEKSLENKVKSDPRWMRAKMLVVDAACISDINRALVDSLRDRKDMLVQMGADRRDEMKGAARLMAGGGLAQDLRERATSTLKDQMQAQ